MRFQQAFEASLTVGDIPLLLELVTESGDVGHTYVSADIDSRNEMRDALQDLTTFSANAGSEGRSIFVAKDDGNGFHVFSCETEAALVGELAKASCAMEIGA